MTATTTTTNPAFSAATPATTGETSPDQTGRARVAGLSDAGAQASIAVAARDLHLPTVRAESTRLAEIAVRQKRTHLGFLAEVLAAEVDDRAERRRIRRVGEARFPRLKRLADFDTDTAPIGAAVLAGLAAGAYLDAGQPVVLLGDSGTD